MRTLAILLSAALLLQSCQFLGEDEKLKEQNDTTLLLVLLGVAYFSNPCNFAGVPSLTSAQPSGSMAAAGSIRGRIVTSAGSPAVGALVIATGDGPIGATEMFSSHSSINRDGTFYIAGIDPLVSASVKLAVEPIYSDYYNRIDTHLDCFATPRSFTAGWARNSGQTLTGSYASGSSFTITAGAVTDAGTIIIN